MLPLTTLWGIWKIAKMRPYKPRRGYAGSFSNRPAPASRQQGNEDWKFPGPPGSVGMTGDVGSMGDVGSNGIVAYLEPETRESHAGRETAGGLVFETRGSHDTDPFAPQDPPQTEVCEYCGSDVMKSRACPGCGRR